MTGLQVMAAMRAGFRRALLAFVFVGGSIAGASAAPMTDPVGDALCNLSGGGSCAVPYDITLIDAVTGGGNIEFTVHLNQNIAQVPSQDPNNLTHNQLGGYIDIDTDQNSATGTFAWGDYFGEAPPWPDPPQHFSGLGDEYYIDLYSEGLPSHAGTVDVWDGPGTVIQGTAPILYGPDWFRIVVPLTLLGNDDGLLNYDVVVGDGTGLTDQAVDYQAVQAGGSPAASVIPEPPAAVLFGFGLALAGIGFLRRRARAT
jgi:hypothetical protein